MTDDPSETGSPNATRVPSRLRAGLWILLPWLWFVVRDLGSWMEVVAIALPAIGLVALVGAGFETLSGRRGSRRSSLASMALMATTAILLPRIPTMTASATTEVTLVSANLTGDSPRAGASVDGLLAIDPDVLVLLEANADVVARSQEIEKSLPFRALAPIVVWSQVAVFSRYEFDQLEIPDSIDTDKILALRIEAPEPFTLVAAHLPRPWLVRTPSEDTPAGRQALMVRLADWIASLDGHVVLAGDLNATDRGIGYRTLLDQGELTDVIRVNWAPTTSTKWWPLLLRIDHVFVRGLCAAGADTVPLEGSDHIGLVARIGRCG